MKPNKIAVLVALILILPFFQAQGMVKALAVEISAVNGEIQIDNAQTVIDYLDEQAAEAPYLVKLKDTQGKTLYQLQTFLFSIETPGQGLELDPDYDIEEFLENQKDNFHTIAFIPFEEEQVYITLESAEGELGRFALHELCNSNGSCQETENYLSCPNDCPLEEKDVYCFPAVDEICDPDCLAEVDPDCMVGPDPAKPVPEPGISPILLALSAAILIVIALIIFKMKK